jgi:hypothetical protein
MENANLFRESGPDKPKRVVDSLGLALSWAQVGGLRAAQDGLLEHAHAGARRPSR